MVEYLEFVSPKERKMIIRSTVSTLGSAAKFFCNGKPADQTQEGGSYPYMLEGLFVPKNLPFVLEAGCKPICLLKTVQVTVVPANEKRVVICHGSRFNSARGRTLFEIQDPIVVRACVDSENFHFRIGAMIYPAATLKKVVQVLEMVPNGVLRNKCAVHADFTNQRIVFCKLQADRSLGWHEIFWALPFSELNQYRDARGVENIVVEILESV